MVRLRAGVTAATLDVGAAGTEQRVQVYERCHSGVALGQKNDLD